MRMLSTLLILLLISITSITCNRQQQSSLVPKKTVTVPTPSAFIQVAGNNGTISEQVFDKWVIIYEYPTEEHQLLGIANKATVFTNKGAMNNPQRGEEIATASLINPKEFERGAGSYPKLPKEIVVEESHLNQGKMVYKGRLTFEPRGETSRRTGNVSLEGEISSDYFLYWPMYNYIIERRMPRGLPSGASQKFTIMINPE